MIGRKTATLGIDHEIVEATCVRDGEAQVQASVGVLINPDDQPVSRGPFGNDAVAEVDDHVTLHVVFRVR